MSVEAGGQVGEVRNREVKQAAKHHTFISKCFRTESRIKFRVSSFSQPVSVNEVKYMHGQ